MALLPCSECGREISDKAAACPQCGAPVKQAETAEQWAYSQLADGYARKWVAQQLVESYGMEGRAAHELSAQVQEQRIADNRARAGQESTQPQRTSAGTVATGVFGGILGCIVAPFIVGIVLLVLLYTCSMQTAT